MLTLSLLVAPDIVLTITYGATTGGKVGIMTTLGFQWYWSIVDEQHRSLRREVSDGTDLVAECTSCAATHFKVVTTFAPADTWRKNNVIITSKRRRDVIITLCVRWAVTLAMDVVVTAFTQGAVSDYNVVTVSSILLQKPR